MLKAADVARTLGLSKRAVYDLAASGALAHYRPAPGAVRFDPQDVEAYRTSCRSVGTKETAAGVLSSTAIYKDSDTDLAAFFRRAGVKPKLTHTTGKKAPGSPRLRVVSSAETP